MEKFLDREDEIEGIRRGASFVMEICWGGLQWWRPEIECYCDSWLKDEMRYMDEKVINSKRKGLLEHM